MKEVTTILLLILFASVYGRSAIGGNIIVSRIISGDIAPARTFPYIASLQVNGSHLCGGAILNERWILTAAHCLLNLTIAYVGSDNLKHGGTKYEIEASYRHPNYKGPPTFAYDMAIVKVKKNMTFNSLVKSIPLRTTEIKDDESAVLAGWGDTDNNRTKPDDLQYFYLRTLTTGTCQKKISINIDGSQKKTPINLDESQICGFGKANQGFCIGDSGSPLVVNGEAVGLVSRAVHLPCANGYPDIYSNVNIFLGWIKNIMKEH